MGKLFDINNPFWTFVGKLVDVTVLHFIWLICCIPIVTIGPATTALYYSVMKDARDEGSHYVKDFFKSFKLNLKQGIIIGLIMLVFALMLAFAVRFYFGIQSSGMGTTVLKALSILIAVIYIMMFQYVFALQSRFENTIRRTFQNALLFSVRYLGWTVLMIIILAAYILAVVLFVFLPVMIPGFALVVYLDSYILNRIFKPYVKEQLGDDEDEDDIWNIDESEYQAAESPYMPSFYADEKKDAAEIAEEKPEPEDSEPEDGKE